MNGGRNPPRRPAQELRRADLSPPLDLFDRFDDKGQVDADGAAPVTAEAAQAQRVAVRAVTADPRFDRGGIGIVVPAANVQDRVDEPRQVLVDGARGRTHEATRPIVGPVETNGADPPADGLPVGPVPVIDEGVGQGLLPWDRFDDGQRPMV
jgi:hypothetical protein